LPLTISTSAPNCDSKSGKPPSKRGRGTSVSCSGSHKSLTTSSSSSLPSGP